MCVYMWCVCMFMCTYIRGCVCNYVYMTIEVWCCVSFSVIVYLVYMKHGLSREPRAQWFGCCCCPSGCRDPCLLFLYTRIADGLPHHLIIYIGFRYLNSVPSTWVVFWSPHLWSQKLTMHIQNMQKNLKFNVNCAVVPTSVSKLFASTLHFLWFFWFFHHLYMTFLIIILISFLLEALFV